MRVQNRQLGVFVPGNVNNPQLETPFQNTGMGGLGYFAKACYPVPQIPIVTGETKGMGCACNNGPSYGLMGVSDLTSNITLGNWMDAATGTDIINGIPNVLVVGIGAYLLFSVLGDAKRVPGAIRSRRKAAGAARSAYRASLA